MADNYSEQKSTLVIRVPLSEESYASIYFSNHEGRPMNAREWWHLKQVVELASHAFSAPEDKHAGRNAGHGSRRVVRPKNLGGAEFSGCGEGSRDGRCDSSFSRFTTSTGFQISCGAKYSTRCR